MKEGLSSMQRDLAMEKQKELQKDYYEQLNHAKENNRKIVYTFVPGNVSELIRNFDAIPVYPEILALQSGMRLQSDAQIRVAEKAGHSEDVCTYVKCHVGMVMGGNVGPTGTVIPPPDLLLLSYTGCFTFMKWFEVLKNMYPNVPVVMLHMPFQGESKVTSDMVDYGVLQLRQELIPALEKITGNKYDEDKLKRMLALSAKAEEDYTWVLESTRNHPSPIDAFFQGVYYIGPIFNGWRGTQECCDYYSLLKKEVQARISAGKGPVGPEGEIKEKYRLVMSGPQPWIAFRKNWKIFYDWGVVAVGADYPKVGGFFEWGNRHDPNRPLESMAEYCMWCIANFGLENRIKLLENYIKERDADGFVIGSIKSCNGFSACMLPMLKELEKRTGLPGLFIEYDIVDSRYYSYSNIKVRVESYLQMLEERKKIKS